MSSKCPRCMKTVYFAEKVTASGKDYHKLCFRCTSCKKALEPGNFTDVGADILCKGCYGSQHGPQGFGYSSTLSSYKS